MELETSPNKTSPVDNIDDSPSSVTAEPSISDSAEMLISNENTEKDEKEEEERLKYRLARRKALAMMKMPTAVPKLGKVLTTANNTIDLTVEEDDPNNEWFKKTFPGKKKSPESKSFAVPHNIPKRGLKREDMKKQLQASMSAKRRKEQEQRRKMYLEDNERLQQQSDDEEEEEEVIKKKRKAKKPKNDEYNSEDDEDYVPGDSPAENSSDEEADQKKEEKADDEVSVNFMNDSFTFDVFNMKKRPGPGSTASSFDVRSQVGEAAEKNNMFEDLNIQGGASAGLFDLCSDSFVGDGVEDTLQMLLNGDKKTVTATKPSDDVKEDEEEEDNLLRKKTTKSKSSRVIDSDDEVEETPEEALPESYDVFDSNEADVANEETVQPRPQRIILNDDEDSEDENEEEGDMEDEEQEEEDDNEDEEEEEEPQEEEQVPEPNFDDEDDELAVIKRIEHKEYSQKIKKKTLFDDEASLSGDDVGSDVDDEEGVENAYELEEGDADDVPDDDTIRRENYKLMLKQENAKEQRALAKLQERLLADGDLGAVETNRQFRFKLREEAEIRVGADDGDEEEQEEEEPEEDEESKKARAEMIKYKLEHAAELEMLDHPGEEDDVFRRAGIMMKTVKKTVVETSEEITIKCRVGKPSLLSKSSLAASFQEVLGGGVSAPKQMYVQTRNPTTSSEWNRLSTGGVKRGRQSPEPTSSVKRVRQGKLSALE